MKRLLVNTALVVVSVAVPLLAFDVFLFFTRTEPPAEARAGYFVQDDRRDFALRPGYSSDDRTLTASVPITINADGYRDTEWRFDAETRILVLGDSFTFGTSLPIEESIVWKLRAHFAGDPQFYNAGVPAYGPHHARKTLEIECGRVRPRVVYYLFFVNDLSWYNSVPGAMAVEDGNLYYAKKPHTDEPFTAEELAARRAKVGEGATFDLFDSLRLLNIRNFLTDQGIGLRRILEMIRGTDSLDDEYLKRYLFSVDAENYRPEYAEAAADELERMAARARECGARFAMVILPTHGEAYYGLREPATTRFTDVIAHRKLDVEILDLRSHAPGEEILHIPHDTHLNSKGTTWAAGVIADHLATFAPGSGS